MQFQALHTDDLWALAWMNQYQALLILEHKLAAFVGFPGKHFYWPSKPLVTCTCLQVSQVHRNWHQYSDWQSSVLPMMWSFQGSSLTSCHSCHQCHSLVYQAESNSCSKKVISFLKQVKNNLTADIANSSSTNHNKSQNHKIKGLLTSKRMLRNIKKGGEIAVVCK